MKKIIFTFLCSLNFINATGVAAGTEIKNIAYLDYVVSNVAMKTQSNKLVDIVDQKLDMNFGCQESSDRVVEAGTQSSALKFMLKNSGNGEDKYSFTFLEGESRDFKVSNIRVYKDDGDGLFSLSTDTLITELALKADEESTLFLVSDIPVNISGFSSNGILVNSKIQGSLTYGESVKLEDYYAVVATQEDANRDLCTYQVPNIKLELEKKATLSSAKLYKGSTIHYELIVRATGTGSIDSATVSDDFPQGTNYVKDTLMLDGELVGEVTEKGFSVELGSIVQEEESSEPLHRITFDVRVQS